MNNERTPPRVEDAPGLTWRLLKGGWEARWRPRTDLVKRGYPPTPARLWIGWELNDTERDWISDRCRALQGEMLFWGRGGDATPVATFDGTIRGLIYCYQTDPDSTYSKLRFQTRKGYDFLCTRINRDHADARLSETKARTLKRWHEDWTAKGHIALGHSLVGMLRTLFSFGKTILEDKECERLSGLLHDMRFTMATPRKERLTAEQAIALRAKAHEQGRHSIALAQAFQFELALRQKDVIGEWVPQSEPGPLSDVLNGQHKWLRGIRWSEIDQNLILRHTTSKRNKDIEVDLHGAPMVMEELAHIGNRPSSGPIIVQEGKGIPYEAVEFRRQWRLVAQAAGIPDNVFNMDSRAGALTEATDSGASLEDTRHLATHSDIGMTQKYSRGSFEKVANVMDKRVAHRNKTGTKKP